MTNLTEIVEPSQAWESGPADWPDHVAELVGDLAEDLTALTCAAGELCAHEPPARIGYVEDAHEDAYGREYEDLRWETPFGIEPGVLVCEDCGSNICDGDLVYVDGRFIRIDETS